MPDETPDAEVRVRVPGTEPTEAADAAVFAATATTSASDPEPVFVDPLRPTGDERARWEAWRDAKDRARSEALEDAVVAQGFPTPDPRTEIDAAKVATGLDNPGASRSVLSETIMAANGEAAVPVAPAPEPDPEPVAAVQVADGDAVATAEV